MKDRLSKFLAKKKDEDYYAIKPGIFHASESGKCSRYIFLERTNRIEDTTEQKKYFLLGDIFHEFFLKHLFQDYICEQEISYDCGDFKIVGRADAYNAEEVIDLKTCKDANYIFEPKPENVVQINIYMRILELNKGRLIYIGKNNLSIKEFKIKYDEDLFRKTLKKLRFINNKLKNKADYTEINIQPNPKCYYCKYNKICYPNQNENS